MIHLQAQEAVRVAAKVAARGQAWRDGRGVLGVPMRADRGAYTNANVDLTVVFDAIDGAHVLVWAGTELTVRRRGEFSRHFAIHRPGSEDDRLAVVLAPDAGDSPEVVRLGATTGGATVTGSLSALAGFVFSGTSSTGKVPAVSGRLAGSLGPVMVWEVDDPAGRPLFRVADIDLAADLYHAAPAGSHLLPVLAAAGGRS